MNRATSLVAVLLLALGVWYWWAARPSAPATITITTPAKGEAWQAGEVHTIAWQTQGVSSKDRVSITIRRVPPPALQSEGQEFDPILFTDLSNSGSTTWKISRMYPSGTYVLGLTAYAGVPVTNPISSESASFTITHPKIAIDLYPLYTGANWDLSAAENIVIGTTTYQGARMTSASIEAGMDPGSVITPFTKYYSSLLKSHGWHVVNALAAGGHVGGQEGYQNGPGTILVGYHIDYATKPPNAPSECPCIVTLSLFSSGATD